MIVPTIGRVVLYKFYAGQPEPFPALVCHVSNERQINLGGFDAVAEPFGATGVTLLQDDDQIPAEGPFAYWMDYQKQAAKKAESVETPVEPLS